MHEPLGAVRKPLAEASHAPGFIYGAPDVYRTEIERLVMRDWLLVARDPDGTHDGQVIHFTHGPFPPLATLAGRLGGGA